MEIVRKPDYEKTLRSKEYKAITNCLTMLPYDCCYLITKNLLHKYVIPNLNKIIASRENDDKNTKYTDEYLLKIIRQNIQYVIYKLKAYDAFFFDDGRFVVQYSKEDSDNYKFNCYEGKNARVKKVINHIEQTRQIINCM